MNFASNLQKLRKRENISQEALAEKLDVTLDQTDYNAALASNAYKATLTLNVTTIE